MVKYTVLCISYWEIVAVLMLFTTKVEGAVLDKICGVSWCKHGGPDIHFPFWLNHNNSDPWAYDCAYPSGFQLFCGGGGSPGRRENDHVYNKDDTIFKFQYLVNTSIKGLQLSLGYEAIVSFIDYKNLDIYFDDTPYLTDIVPTPVVSNSSSTPNRFHFDFTQNLYSTPYGYTLFNCSSSSVPTVMSSYLVNRDFSSLTTADFNDVHVYSSDKKTIQMLPEIKSCTKMYNISIMLPDYLEILNWSAPAGGWNCEPVQKNCKFNDHARTTSRAYYHVTRGLLVVIILVGIVWAVPPFITLYRFIRWDEERKWDLLQITMFLEDYKSLKPTRYSYGDIKKITNMFKQKLGQGGNGSVFKGQISRDIPVAVKVLHSDSKANGDDFINEVGTIGKIHHVNVVRLLGYCADGCNRALVYEFQPNYSLEKFVYRREKQQSFIGWKKMQNIALGIAKGIKYLHQECEQQILHFDIKPNNILLDQNFNPKISDFGLAKLCNKGQSIVSMTAARGTIGYIAPEVFSRNFGKVSSKSDVYSFGMLLLEMVGGKSNNVVGEQNTSEVYFPEWIFHRLEKGGEMVIQIENEDDSKIARKLTIVGLWCIGWHPIDRPSMKLVIQMLEADECPAMPPNPFSSATSTNATHAKSFFSESLQVISEAG